jgi:hypothetical protein
MGNKDTNTLGMFLLGDEKQLQRFSYDGSPIITAANNNAIFVAGNYRVCLLYEAKLTDRLEHMAS